MPQVYGRTRQTNDTLSPTRWTIHSLRQSSASHSPPVIKPTLLTTFQATLPSALGVLSSATHLLSVQDLPHVKPWHLRKHTHSYECPHYSSSAKGRCRKASRPNLSPLRQARFLLWLRLFGFLEDACLVIGGFEQFGWLPPLPSPGHCSIYGVPSLVLTTGLPGMCGFFFLSSFGG